MAEPAAFREPRMTFDDFLSLTGEDRYEFVDGSIIAMSPVNQRHAQVFDFLYPLFSLLAKEKGSGVVRGETFAMKLDGGRYGRLPDIQFISKENADRMKETFTDGPADLAVEIISPESRGRDRGEKFYEYEAAGVREYWLIDPERKIAEFYELSETGIFAPAAVKDGRFESKVFEGLWIEVEWLWSQPSVIGVLRKLGALD